MEETVLLTVMATYTILAALCSIVFNRLKLPALIGYLVAGIIIANYFTVTHEWHSVVEILADIGLVMLMFSIGMEIDISKVFSQGIFAIKIALIQLPLLVVGGMFLGPALGFSFIQSIALGAIISGSSTAVVLAVLRSQNVLDNEHIELLVLITIMEDIGQVIILSMITPLLAGFSLNTDSIIVMVISILAFMIISLIVGLKFVPRIMNWVSDNVSNEVMVIFAVGLAFGMAILSVHIGLSMAIGAFLMGMLISPCKSSAQLNHQIEPMRNLFMAMFFISVGMEITVDLIIQNIPMIIAIYLVFAILKWITVSLGYWVCASDGRTGFVSAISLIAMGEFAFIIAKEALDYGAFTDSMYTSVIGAALVSMITLPFLTRYADRIWNGSRRHMPGPLKKLGTVMSQTRDVIVAELDSSSEKTRKAYKKGMTNAYFNLILIFIIETAFFWLFDYASTWLYNGFGGKLLWWEIGLVALNMLLLMPPTARLIANAKAISGMVLDNRSRVGGASDNVMPNRLFNSLHRLNTFVVMIAIDFLIVLVVPNPLGPLEHFVCLFIALVFALLAVRKARLDAGAPVGPPEETVPESEDEER